MPSLHNLKWLRRGLLSWRRARLNRIAGLSIHDTASISLAAKFLLRNGGRVEVGERTLVAFNTLIIADGAQSGGETTRIGSRCFVGAGAIIASGVSIGDGCIVAAGAVVLDDIPAGCLAVGNPAAIMREGLDLLDYGRLPHSHGN